MPNIELNSLPKNVRYDRQSLADSNNALVSWLQAIALFPSEPEPESTSSFLLYGPEDVGAVQPTESDYKTLATWCRLGDASLEAVDAGIACDALQFPETNGFGAGWEAVSEMITGLRKLSHLRAIKAKLLERDGDVDGSTCELLKLHRMGQLICNGDGLIVCYLIGSGIRSRALSQLEAAIQSGKLSSTVARLAQDELLLASRREDGLAQACRVELTQFGIPTIERVPESGNNKELIDYLVEQFYETSLISELNDPEEEISQSILDQRQSLRKEQLNLLLSGHPRAFDRDATIRLLVHATSRYISWLEFVMRSPSSQWRHRVRDLISKRDRAKLRTETAGIWPESLSPDFPFDLFGEDDGAETARKELSCTENGEYPPAWRPLSQSGLAVRNQLLCRVANPVGKMLAAKQITFDASSCCFEHGRSLRAAIRSLAQQI